MCPATASRKANVKMPSCEKLSLGLLGAGLTSGTGVFIQLLPQKLRLLKVTTTFRLPLVITSCGKLSLEYFQKKNH